MQIYFFKYREVFTFTFYSLIQTVAVSVCITEYTAIIYLLFINIHTLYAYLGKPKQMNVFVCLNRVSRYLFVAQTCKINDGGKALFKAHPLPQAHLLAAVYNIMNHCADVAQSSLDISESVHCL